MPPNPASLVELVNILELGVRISHHTHQPVRFHGHKADATDDSHHARQQYVARFQPCHAEHHHGRRHQNNGSSQISQNHREGHKAQRQDGGQECVAAIDGAGAQRDEVREENHQRRLGKFTRLQAAWPQTNPAMLLRIGKVNNRQQNHHQTHRGEGNGRGLQLSIVQPLEENQQRQSERHP